MNTTLKRAAAFVSALMIASACMAGCSKSDKKTTDSAGSKSDNKSGSNTDSKLDIFIDADGAPYYIDSDGEKMMLFSSPYESGDEDPTENYIYDHYDSNGLSFDIPSGWYADDSYGSPTMFMDGEEDNFDEYISIVPSAYVLDADKDGNYDSESVIKSYYDEAVSEGYYLSYEITDKGTEKVNGTDAKYYVLKVSSDSFTDEEETDTIRIKYVITPGETSHAVIMTSLDTDESFEKVTGAYESSIASTLTLPTKEQMDEAMEEEELEFDDEELEEDTEDGGDGEAVDFQTLS